MTKEIYMITKGKTCEINNKNLHNNQMKKTTKGKYFDKKLRNYFLDFISVSLQAV
jgi:hypothetical protein